MYAFVLGNENKMPFVLVRPAYQMLSFSYICDSRTPCKCLIVIFSLCILKLFILIFSAPTPDKGRKRKIPGAGSGRE